MTSLSISRQRKFESKNRLPRNMHMLHSDRQTSIGHHKGDIITRPLRRTQLMMAVREFPVIQHVTYVTPLSILEPSAHGWSLQRNSSVTRKRLFVSRKATLVPNLDLVPNLGPVLHLRHA